jgi:hypothetical protein
MKMHNIGKAAEKKVRCACVRCGRVLYLFPDEIGALHYTQRDGYCCGPEGRYMPARKEKKWR